MSDTEPDFQIEEELLEAVPRRVVATKGTLLAWRFAWNVLLGIVCLIYCFGSSEMNDLKELATHGQVINGYVVTARKLSNAADDSGCKVVYALKRNSNVADKPFELPDWVGSLPQAGDAFQVTYLPQTPSIHRLGEVGPGAFADCQSHWIAVGLWWVFPYLLVMWFVKCCEESGKQRLRFGTATVATVKSRRETKGENATVYHLSYGFSFPDGRHQTDETSVSKALYDAYPEGRKFSVLVGSTYIDGSTPYFSVTGVMINNAPKRSFL